jgi:hypothetical protein
MNHTIRVDTDDLKKKALRLLEISDIFSDIGNRVRGDCLSVPSYNNQLLDPAKKATTQVLYETGAMRDAFQWSGTFVATVAGQFEKTDTDSLEFYINFYSECARWGINLLKYLFLGIEPLEGDKTNGYRELLAYEEKDNLITIWYGGQSVNFDLSDPSLDPAAREELKEKLQKFKERMKDSLDHLKDFLGGNEDLFLAALAIISSGFKITDIINWLSKLRLIDRGVAGNEEDLKESQEAYYEAAAIWQELNSNDVPGKVPLP